MLQQHKQHNDPLGFHGLGFQPLVRYVATTLMGTLKYQYNQYRSLLVIDLP